MNTDFSEMSLKDKCKFYQKRRDYRVDENAYIIVHIDGRSFSKMIKNKFEKPFDKNFINMMDKTAIYACENVQGVKLAYVQSDEITLLIKKPNFESDIFFGGRLCKMQSIIASIVTSKFNQLLLKYNISKNSYSNTLEDCDTTLYNIKDVLDYIDVQKLCQFDCKVWDVPTENDVITWFLFRNIDCVRNSKQQTAQSYLPHKLLLNKSADEQVQFLYEKEGIDWNKFNENLKYGRLIIREQVECSREENGKTITFNRNKWAIKDGIDLTNITNRDILKEMLI